MTPEQVEAKVIELIHREPFAPFAVELRNGQLLEVTYPGLAINAGGAGFIGADGGLVDFEFKDVLGIRPISFETIA